MKVEVLDLVVQQVSSTAGFSTNPNSPDRRGFNSPLGLQTPSKSGLAESSQGDKGLRDALAAAEAKLKAAESSLADKNQLQEKVCS